ncbi:glycosyltransferase [Persephonella atlantica]|uniref:Glycosyltransferase n=1 Tax=Persephonella atlantica TaxID=2699429 RepID=A0ABS1GJW0_9AQUI|nr:glycosyltransferase family 2 protein [Persephonella atlantica]MBK3333197.1 glycosyltransferase [Persephonella atlantica]
MEKIVSAEKLIYRLLDEEYLDDNGKIKKEYKFKINLSEFGIINSKITSKKDRKFNTYLFLPEREKRKGEGGLRTKGYFKFSYKLINNKWYICNIDGYPIKSVDKELEKSIRKYAKSNSLNLKELPLVSIITVVYNGEKYLEETIQSVINQVYPNIEYIIIDGGSTDGTLDIIRKYENYIDYWVSEPDDGIYDAMNKGIKSATGMWINFMNAGDSFTNREVLTKIKFHIYKEKALIYGNKIQNGEIIFPLDITKLEVGEIMACHQAMFFNKRVLKHELFYNVKYKIYGDYELVNRIYLKNPENLVYINEAICMFRGGGVSSKTSFQKRKDKYLILLNSYGISGLLRGILFRIKKGIYK